MNPLPRLDTDFEVQARECERMAKNSVSEVDRASWLRLAEEWLQLIPGRHGEPSET